VGFQATTAMGVLADTATGTAQRFLWFTALGSEDTGPGMVGPVVHMADAAITRLAESVGHHNELLYTITVVPSITERVRAQQRHIRLTRDIAATDDYDAHRHALVAKLAALAVLADGRVLVAEYDWSWAEAVYDASAAVRDELLALAEERETDERRGQAVRMASDDRVRKAYPNDVVRVAQVLMRRVERNGGPLGRQKLRDAVAGRDRAYFPDALEYAAAQGWRLIV
jgi:tryptophanyl-tRNA synthetase